ncbi:TPA: hypothetical protein U5D93_003501 [Yersinia enterocolitica]|nr:hypothetical protein [Yersinia enterocolitica]HDL8420932.1 hypothetical protein [Yersinia enterocolitica]HEN3302919.1 hypothetical protein [Yersinia enterocolitica]HEN3393379.1 hypothetical protein [Yersinia enterocolitica]
MMSLSDTANKVTELEGKINHLLVRSELTLYILSAMIEAGVVKREGVEELIRDAKFVAPEISQAIIEKEKEIVSSVLRKVKLS